MFEPAATLTEHPWVADADTRVRFGIIHPLIAGSGEWPTLRDAVLRVEELGFDSYWFSDHPMMNPDCWTRIAALSAVTRRIRLGTVVTCIYYRHPALLARIVADCDRISGGRIVLGLGIGDFVPEFDQLDLPFPPTSVRQEALEETIRILQGLWSGDSFTFDGKHMAVRDARLQPVPVQQPRVPILIAGAGERVTLRQVAQFADASNFGPNPHTGNVLDAAAITAKLAALDGHCAAIARPPRTIMRTYWSPPIIVAETRLEVERKVAAVTADEWRFYGEHLFSGSPDAAIDHFQRVLDAGMDYVITHTRGDLETARLLAKRVIPALRPGRHRAAQA